MTKGVIYDLDGTIIDTTHLHEMAWQEVGDSLGIHLSAEMLVKQKGVSNEEAVRLLFPSQGTEKVEQLVQKKNEYIANNFGKFVEVKGIAEVISELQKKEYKVWICTSAPKEFVMRVASEISVVDDIKDNIVWREMCKEGKPSPEPLLFTLKQMGLQAPETVFVGDAWSDYKASIAAKIPFLYFSPEYSEPDSTIPDNIPRLKNHKEIFEYLKGHGE